jgi:hypothetical protein
MTVKDAFDLVSIPYALSSEQHPNGSRSYNICRRQSLNHRGVRIENIHAILQSAINALLAHYRIIRLEGSNFDML